MRVDIKAILRDEKQRARLLKGACEFLHKLECRKEACSICEERNTKVGKEEHTKVQSATDKDS